MANKFTKSVLERQAKEFKRETGAARAAASAPTDEIAATTATNPNNPQAVTAETRSPLQGTTPAKAAASAATASGDAAGNTYTNNQIPETSVNSIAENAPANDQFSPAPGAMAGNTSANLPSVYESARNTTKAAPEDVRATNATTDRQAGEFLPAEAVTDNLIAQATSGVRSAEAPTAAGSAVAQQVETPSRPTVAAPTMSSAPANARTSEPIPTTAGKRRSAPLDLDAYLVRDGGRSAKNKTFYLDDAVIDGLHSAATARGIPDSKLVNDILRKVLGV